MKKILSTLAVQLILATGTPALAAVHHGRAAPYSHVNSGWGPPSNWNEIEISHPEGGG
jgi:hypothetical protein